jgi:hypothetical protein
MTNFKSEYLVQGQALGQTSKVVSLTADNTVVNAYSNDSGYSMICMESDNTTAANRTFTLLDGRIDGHQLMLLFTSGSSTTCQLANSGNVVLTAAWEPLQDESLTLVWSARRSKWEEVARKATAAPAYAAILAGTFTTLGGDATESITATGAVSTDIVSVTLRVVGATPRTILTAIPTTDAITVTMSGDPSTDHVLQYVVFRSIV